MLNKVMLMGRLTKDPELRYTSNNIAVCSFTIAVDRNFVKQGEQKQADFINCQAWRSTAEFISKYFAKGRMIAVVGAIQTRTWDDTEGKKHYATGVVVNEVSFTGEKADAQSNTTIESGFTQIDSDDELPF